MEIKGFAIINDSPNTFKGCKLSRFLPEPIVKHEYGDEVRFLANTVNRFPKEERKYLRVVPAVLTVKEGE